MRRLRWLGSITALAAIAGCGGEPGDVTDIPGDAEAPGEAVFAPEDATELWFVELGHAPTARGGERAALLEERARFARATQSIGIRYKQRFSFERLWNGLSVRVLADSAQRLRDLPGVTAIYPVLPVDMDGDASGGAAGQDLASAVTMTGADIVHSQLGFTGEKVLVGVIDSGIDYDHPDLGGCFGPGCRVAYGYDFVGDDYDARDGSTQPVEDPDPDDCGGHGTHVAGIVGANGAVAGVAPDVTFGAYRVFGCNGSTNTDIMMKAMERAEADGMRVVNMSIGSPFAWPSYPSAKAANQLVENGVVVVTSTGNSGTSGLWAAGAPGVGEHVIASASIENLSAKLPTFSASPGGTLVGYGSATGAPPAPTSGTAPLARTGTPASTADACSALPAGSLTGAVALIRRGGCTFNAKVANAQAAGAVGVVIYNNALEFLSATVASGTPIVIPVVTTTASLGQTLNDLMDQGPITITWTDEIHDIANDAGNLVSSFSSYGLTSTLSFKPDIAAPGGSIYSTYPLEEGGYGTLSGTSMASPHVAGAVALLLNARSELAPAEVRDLLQNNALPEMWSGNPTGGVPDATYRQGAGIVQIDRAILATTRITPGKLALGESESGPSQVTLTLRNDGANAVTYDLSHLAAISTPAGDHWAPTNSATGAAAVQPSAPSVTVPAGGTATVDVTITADAALAEGSLYGGYIVFTPVGGTAADALHVPYAGFVGDYQSVPVLTPTSQGYPWLAKRSGSTYTNQPNGATFTLQAGDVPYVRMHKDHNAQEMKIEVFSAATNKPYGVAYEASFVFQNDTPTGVTSISWSGYTTLNKKTALVPNGSYVLKLSALRAMGDPANPAHWDTWTSPPVTLNHP